MTIERITTEEAEHPLFLGVDVGGTSIKVGVIDNLGRRLAATSFPTSDHLGPQNAVDRMRQQSDQLLEKLAVAWEDISAIGLGTPGTMDIAKGMILEPPNLPGWRHFAIRDALSQACHNLPVTYANDAGAAAYGEYWVGAGQQFHSMVMFTLGTGVGGGIIVGDLSIDGEHSHGAECGHIMVETAPGARICSCGRPGHLEAYASATAVVRRTQEALEANRTSSLNERLANGESLSALIVAQEAEAGDELCQELIMETADYLARGVATLAHIINPSAMIFGGAMNFGGASSPLGRRFLQRIKSGVAELAFPVIANNTVIEFASLGGDAGYIGAAGLARREHKLKLATG